MDLPIYKWKVPSNKVYNIFNFTFYNFSDKFSRFSRVTPDTQATFISHRIPFLVNPDDWDRIYGREENGCETNTSGFTVYVQDVRVTLRRSVEFSDVFNSEPWEKIELKNIFLSEVLRILDYSMWHKNSSTFTTKKLKVAVTFKGLLVAI